MESNVILAFALTAFAGLSTGIGSALAFFTRQTNKKFLATSLGFSAGVMIYVSFVEILVKAGEALSAVHGDTAGAWYTALGFFGGILIISIIDRLVPVHENPHEPHVIEEMDQSRPADRKLMRMGTMAALAIGIHNFPEGLATFAAALNDPAIGISIAVAIAIPIISRKAYRSRCRSILPPAAG